MTYQQFYFIYIKETTLKYKQTYTCWFVLTCIRTAGFEKNSQNDNFNKSQHDMI